MVVIQELHVLKYGSTGDKTLLLFKIEEEKQHIPDFGITCHFVFWIMNINCILNDCAIFIDFNLLCDSRNSKIVTVSIKFNTKKQKHKRQKLMNITYCFLMMMMHIIFQENTISDIQVKVPKFLTFKFAKGYLLTKFSVLLIHFYW